MGSIEVEGENWVSLRLVRGGGVRRRREGERHKVYEWLDRYIHRLTGYLCAWVYDGGSSSLIDME